MFDNWDILLANNCTTDNDILKKMINIALNCECLFIISFWGTWCFPMHTLLLSCIYSSAIIKIKQVCLSICSMRNLMLITFHIKSNSVRTRKFYLFNWNNVFCLYKMTWIITRENPAIVSKGLECYCGQFQTELFQVEMNI